MASLTCYVLDPFHPQQPNLDALRKARVGKERQQEDWPIRPGEVGQAQRGSQRRIGQPRTEGHYRECGDQ